MASKASMLKSGVRKTGTGLFAGMQAIKEEEIKEDVKEENKTVKEEKPLEEPIIEKEVTIEKVVEKNIEEKKLRKNKPIHQLVYKL